MHPIIKEYINTNTRLEEVIEKYYQKDNFFEVIFLELAKTSGHKINFDPSIYAKIDQAIIKGHPDQNIYLLFIQAAIVVTNSQGQIEKAKSLQSIAASLSQEKIHPLFHALNMQASTIVLFYEENMEEALKIMKVAVSLVDQNLPRYRSILGNYATMLAGEGKLNDLDENELKTFNNSSTDSQLKRILYTKILNCIPNGNYQIGLSLINEYQLLPPDKSNDNIPKAINIFNIISGDLDATHYEDESVQFMVQSFRYLSEGNINDALKFYKLYLNSSGYLKTISPLDVYIALNLELGMGNKINARKILEEKKAIGNYHYLDDLFYARIQLLEKNIEGANRSFVRLLDNVDHYDAMCRIQFELQFAKELKTSDLFIVLKKWKNIEIIVKPEIKKSPTVTSKLNGLKLLIGKSIEINQIKEQVKKYAPLKEIILITGETGTGKELVAKALHEESAFHKEPFMAINCGALTDTLLESELFGYEAGSFTGAVKQKKGIFEAVGKGTVFLDEFGDISPKLQVSLLRVLESNEIRMIGGSASRKVECRIVVATNINLKQAVEAKKFREDLYFRLARLEIRIPALRERISDIPELVKHFLEGSSGISGNQKTVSKEFLNILSQYQWPGNIRELKNCIDRLRILNPEKDTLNEEDLNFIQFQGTYSLPKNVENITQEKSLTFEPLKNKQETPLNDDPVFNMIFQKGLNTEQRIQYLKQLFLKYKILTRGQVTEIAKVNPVTANKDLQKLCEEGFIIKRTPTKSYRSNYYEII